MIFLGKEGKQMNSSHSRVQENLSNLNSKKVRHWALRPMPGKTNRNILVATQVNLLPIVSGGAQYVCNTLLPFASENYFHLLIIGDKGMEKSIESNLSLYAEYFYSVTFVEREVVPKGKFKKALYFGERLLWEMPFLDISFYTPYAVSAVRTLVDAYDINMLELHSMHTGYLKFFFPNVPTLLVSHNIESDIFPFWTPPAPLYLRIFLKFIARQSRANAYRSEIENIWGFDAITFISLGDLYKVTPAAHKYYLPLSFPVANSKYEDKPSDVFNVLWLGSFSWWPNEEGMRWFFEKIFPLLREKLEDSNIVFHIVGSNPTPFIQSFHDGKHVFIHGFVDDISALFNDTHMLIAPLLNGGGVRVKVIEAISKGVPVLGTSKGCEGIGLKDKVNVWLADMPQDFADSLLYLAANKNVCSDLSAAGEKFMVRYFNIDKSINIKRSIYDNLLAKVPDKQVLKRKLPPFVRRCLKKVIKKIPGIKRVSNAITHNCSEIRSPYDGLTYLKPIECVVIDKSFQKISGENVFTVVIPVKNESASMPGFLKSLAEQISQPKEYILIDHGSEDDTCDLIEKYSRVYGLPIRLLHAKNSPQSLSGKKATVAGNRNYAVNESTTDIIVFTDAGTALEKNFLTNIVGPLAEDAALELVGGIYDAQTLELCAKLVYDWDTLEWDTFLPACRSLAVRKRLFERVGGLPEFLTFAGEDSFFGIACRRTSRRWIFNKQALVHWTAPDTFGELWRKYYNYGVGDGENGVGDFTFYVRTVYAQQYGVPTIDTMSPDPVYAAFNGYLAGRLRRGQLDRARNIKRIVLLCVEKPLFAAASSMKILEALVDDKCRVVCVIADNTVSNNGKAVFIDADVSLYELHFLKYFSITDFVGRYGREDLFFSLELMEDPQNTSPRVKQFLNKASNFSEGGKYA